MIFVPWILYWVVFMAISNSTALLFSGQGAQKVGMGSSLYENSTLARDIYDRADDILGWSLSEASFQGPEELLTETRVCQPALFVMGYALYAILKEDGRLDGLKAVIGLSLGELTALAAAEAFDFETGLRLVAERGRLMQQACAQTKGGMASLIGGTVAEAENLCAEFDIDLANLNCPGQTVVAGPVDRIEAALAAAKERGVFRMVVPLKVAGAYHSRLMEPAREGFADYLAECDVKKPSLPVYSNTHAKVLEDPPAIREALTRQLVSTVRWEDCMRNAATLGIDVFYECGPGKVLSGLARRTNKTWKMNSLAEYSDLNR